MTVKDILKKSATLSGREDVVEYLSSCGQRHAKALKHGNL